MKNVKYKDYDCIVNKGKYMNNDNLALMLIDENDGSPIAYITVNTDEKLPDDFGYLKNYSENFGMLEAMEEAGIVEKVISYKTIGWASVPLVKFNLEDIDEI